MKLAEILKEGTSWKDIYTTNKAVIGANPNLIKPGQKLTMPDGSTHTVASGDTLSKIAANFKPTASPVAPAQSGQQAAAQPAEKPAADPLGDFAAQKEKESDARVAAAQPAPVQQVAQAAQAAPKFPTIEVDPTTSTGFDWGRLMKNAGLDPITNTQAGATPVAAQPSATPSQSGQQVTAPAATPAATPATQTPAQSEPAATPATQTRPGRRPR